MRLVDDAVSADEAAHIRTRMSNRWTRYALLDRGSYDFIDSLDEPALISRLAALVGNPSLTVRAARAVRMLPGDYALVRHDQVYDDRPIEVVVDLSAAAVPGAEVHYRHRGQVFFVVPSRPGVAAVVERGPTVMRNSTYVSKRFASAEVVRLFLLLQ